MLDSLKTKTTVGRYLTVALTRIFKVLQKFALTPIRAISGDALDIGETAGAIGGPALGLPAVHLRTLAVEIHSHTRY